MLEKQDPLALVESVFFSGYLAPPRPKNFLTRSHEATKEDPKGGVVAPAGVRKDSVALWRLGITLP